jgi:intein-encoded DNA endonuclease-like protein
MPSYQKLINHDFLDEINEHSAYFLGFFMADGYINKNSINICINQKDIEILEYFQKMICPDIPIKKFVLTTINGNPSYMCNYRFTSKILANKLYGFGVQTPKSGKEIFPPMPSKYIKDFIRGYFDGDGHVSKKGQLFSTIVCSNKDFLKTLINYVGASGSLMQTQPKLFRIKYHYRDSMIFRDFIYYDGCFSLYRKREGFYRPYNIKNRPFTVDEIDFIKNSNLTCKELGNILGRRGTSIYVKLAKMGCRGYKPYKQNRKK